MKLNSRAWALLLVLSLSTRVSADMQYGFSEVGGVVTQSAGGATMTAPDDVEAYGRRALAAGAKAVRMEFPWKGTRDVATNPANVYVEGVRRLRALGLEVVVILCSGYTSQAGWSPDDGSFFASSDAYRDAAAAQVRDTVRALLPLGVHRYQLENELNAAGLTTLPPFGWRTGLSWFDPSFKDSLVSSLARAVKIEDPGARVTMNFQDSLTDPTDTADSCLARWGSQLDDVGVDFYPNYALPWPVMGALVGSRVRHYKDVTGKPVIVAETGYPSTGYGHSEWWQADFVAQVMDSAKDAGAAGFFYLTLEDTYKGPVLATLDPNRRIEPYWGLLDAFGNPKKETRWTLSGWRLVKQERSAYGEYRSRATR